MIVQAAAMKFAANLNYLFQDQPIEMRFRAAKSVGFDGAEMLFPYEAPEDRLAAYAAEAELPFALINAPAGNWAAGERGVAALPGREADFHKSIDRALRYAEALGRPNIHVMSGRIDHDDEIDRAFETLVSNLRWAATIASDAGVTLTIEPINDRDMPGYLIHHLHQARDVIRAVGADSVALQFDVYHRQVMEGDVIRAIQASADVAGYFQIAGPPERIEPDAGELNMTRVVEAIAACGYTGYIGCEYRPTGARFDWLTPLKAIEKP